MLNLQNISCGYDSTPVVEEISLQLATGGRLCIVGPNGCGKSTLLKAIVGLLPYTGTITLDGTDARSLGRRAMAGQVALMSQISTVYFSYTVREAVMMGRYAQMQDNPFAEPSKADGEAVERCMEAVNIAHLQNRAITDLSGGELQRVFLAKAFAQDPKLLLLDEPTNHLDLRHQIELIRHLKAWSEAGDRMVIAVLHDINLALSFADQILVMSHGRRVAYDDKGKILAGDCLNQVYGLDVKAYMLHAYGQWDV